MWSIISRSSNSIQALRHHALRLGTATATALRPLSVLPSMNFIPSKAQQHQDSSPREGPQMMSMSTLPSMQNTMFRSWMVRPNRFRRQWRFGLPGQFDEMDEIMKIARAALERPTFSPWDSVLRTDLKKLGLDMNVAQNDEKEFKVTVDVPNFAVKDLTVQLDREGRLLCLKGNRVCEEGGMKVQSSFEKSISLSPDLDTSKIKAKMTDGTLAVSVPRKETKEALKEAPQTIDIDYELTDATEDEILCSTGAGDPLC